MQSLNLMYSLFVKVPDGGDKQSFFQTGLAESCRIFHANTVMHA